MGAASPIPLTTPSYGPRTAKRTRGKGAKGGRGAATLAARPAQAVAPYPRSPRFSREVSKTCLRTEKGIFCERRRYPFCERHIPSRRRRQGYCPNEAWWRFPAVSQFECRLTTRTGPYRHRAGRPSLTIEGEGCQLSMRAVDLLWTIRPALLALARRASLLDMFWGG